MHVDGLIEAVSSLNWQTVIAIFIVVWYFTRDTKKTTEELLKEVKSIHSDLQIMNTRLSRIEGTVYGNQIYKNIEKD